MHQQRSFDLFAQFFIHIWHRHVTAGQFRDLQQKMSAMALNADSSGTSLKSAYHTWSVAVTSLRARTLGRSRKHHQDPGCPLGQKMMGCEIGLLKQ
jgi:hypothetical protein